jgi:hypothetical protein
MSFYKREENLWPSHGAASSSDLVEVLDMSQLVLYDAFNGSYLEIQDYRGRDDNSSFFPGYF